MTRLNAVLVAALLGAMGASAMAQTYPSKSVRLVVPFAIGGPVDVLGRLLGDKLSQAWGQAVVIDNRGGAGGNIGADIVAKAPADGYTLLLTGSNHVINASVYKDLPYDPIKDFTPISEVASYMLVLSLHPAVPARTLAEFIAYAKARRGGLSVANAGSGTPTHLGAALFALVAGVEFVHVPYRGGSPATNDLTAGQVTVMFNNPINSVPLVKAGRLRALAVTGLKRLALLPDVPTVAELGYPGFQAGAWVAVWGPAGLAPQIVTRIHADLITALQSADIRQKLGNQGWNISGTSPAEFAAYERRELEKWAKVVKAASVKVD